MICGLFLINWILSCSPSTGSLKKMESASTNPSGTEVAEAVDVQPQLIGGMSALQKELSLPEEFKNSELQEAVVIIRVLIDKTGDPAETEVLQQAGFGCDEVAVTAVKKMKFTPAVKDGEPVKTKISIPLRFRKLFKPGT